MNEDEEEEEETLIKHAQQMMKIANHRTLSMINDKSVSTFSLSRSRVRVSDRMTCTRIFDFASQQHYLKNRCRRRRRRHQDLFYHLVKKKIVPQRRDRGKKECTTCMCASVE